MLLKSLSHCMDVFAQAFEFIAFFVGLYNVVFEGGIASQYKLEVVGQKFGFDWYSWVSLWVPLVGFLWWFVWPLI
jgi:hypothetical protein